MDNVVATMEEVLPQKTTTEGEAPPKGQPYAQGGDEPLEIYRKENKLPLINKLLEVDELMPVDLQKNISSIDGYILDLMALKGYGPTSGAYGACLEQFKKELSIDKNTTLEAGVERMSKYIEAESMLKELKELDEEKILKKLRKSPTESLMALVMKQVEKRGL